MIWFDDCFPVNVVVSSTQPSFDWLIKVRCLNLLNQENKSQIRCMHLKIFRKPKYDSRKSFESFWSDVQQTKPPDGRWVSIWHPTPTHTGKFTRLSYDISKIKHARASELKEKLYFVPKEDTYFRVLRLKWVLCLAFVLLLRVLQALLVVVAQPLVHCVAKLVQDVEIQHRLELFTRYFCCLEWLFLA